MVYQKNLTTLCTKRQKKKTIIADGFSIRKGFILKISVGNTLYSPFGGDEGP